MYIPFGVFLEFFIDTEWIEREISGDDLSDVIELLGPDDFQKLFDALQIHHRDVQKAEERSGTKDVDLKAKAVLRHWKQTQGHNASRQHILDALYRCGNIQAKENLIKIWKIKGNFLQKIK